MSRPFDLLVYGASGFTGRLVARYLAQHAPASLRWGLAGRDHGKLAKIAAECRELNSSLGDIGIVTGHGDTAINVARATRVVVTTAGPYALYGEPLVAACVEAGTDYADLTGETLWAHQMIEKYAAAAKAKGVLLINMSGFDSEPADLGTFFLVDHAHRTLGVGVNEVISYVLTNGSMSGGTVASGLNMARHPQRAMLSDPFLLVPESAARPRASLVVPAADATWPYYVPEIKRYAWLSIMAAINSRVVRRSAALFALEGAKLAGNANSLAPLPGASPAAPLAYSAAPFKYQEFATTGSWLSAVGATLMLGLVGLLQALPGGLAVLRWLLPKPGEGPSDRRIARSWFQYYLVGRTEEAQPRTVIARVAGGCPGYGETAKMIAETGIAMALHRAELPGTALGGGFLTPATALGSVLVRKLDEQGLRFEILQGPAQAAALAAVGGKPAPRSGGSGGVDADTDGTPASGSAASRARAGSKKHA